MLFFLPLTFCNRSSTISQKRNESGKTSGAILLAKLGRHGKGLFDVWTFTGGTAKKRDGLNIEIKQRLSATCLRCTDF